MSELNYNALPELLTELKAGKIQPVYLLYGDEFLYRSALRSVVDALVLPQHQDLNYEAIDGENENVYEIIQHLNTFPLIAAVKVIAVQGTRVFYSAVEKEGLLSKSKEAFARQDLQGAAGHLLYILGMAGMSLDDVREGNWEKVSDKKLKEILGASLNGRKPEGGGDNGGEWLDQVIAFCLQKEMAVPVYQHEADVLNDAILAGYPETNCLVLTADLVDKRRRLYKTVKKIGAVVDCSLPNGDNRADRQRQQAALRSHMKRVLREAGKTAGPGGFESLYEKIGSDLRSFDSELEKVITFVGERKEIQPADIARISKRTKQDPIYEIGNAIAERDTQKALFFTHSLLEAGLHPLQVLSAMANQIRRLILAKDLLRSKYGAGWRKDLSYQAFQKTVFPGIEEREPDLLTDGVHPYAIYKTLQNSYNYTLEELIRALELLLDTDLRLKSAGQNPKMVLEYGVLSICKIGDHETARQGTGFRRE